MAYLFKSSRLGFRQWSDKDLPNLIKMNANPKVMQFFPKLYSSEESQIQFKRFKDQFQKNGYCFYPVDELKSGKFIGFIGLSETNFTADFTPCIEIGWRLLPQFWNKGFATEGAKRCIVHAFEVLDIEELYAFTAKINVPSENVMKKIGMKCIEEFNHPKLESGHPLEEHILYYLNKDTED